LKQPSQTKILEKLNFVVNSGFLNDQFGGVKRSLNFLGEAGTFRLVISESKIRRGLNQKVSTVNRGGFAQGGVKLHRALALNIFTRVSANPANCCGLLRNTILYKTHNSSQDLQ
jgi:hypothetical protein